MVSQYEVKAFCDMKMVLADKFPQHMLATHGECYLNPGSLSLTTFPENHIS